MSDPRRIHCNKFTAHHNIVQNLIEIEIQDAGKPWHHRESVVTHPITIEQAQDLLEDIVMALQCARREKTP